MKQTALTAALLLAFGIVASAQAASPYEFHASARTLKVTGAATAPTSTPTPPSSSTTGPTLTYQAQLSSSTVGFGAHPVGESSTKSLVLTNTGSGALTLQAPSIAGAGFSATTDCGATLPVGASCLSAITYLATTPGDASSTVTFGSNATAGPLVATLSGSAYLTYQADVSPNSLAFGNLAVGRSDTKSVVLTNTGSGDLTLQAPTVSGQSFSTTSTCGATLAAQASCVVSVTYAPTAEGSNTGNLTLGSNATAGSSVVALSGSAYQTDPYYANVAFLMSARTTSGTTLNDAGPSHASVTNTNGTMVVGISPFGASGRSFKTNGNGYFSPAVSPAVGANSFTYETWVYFDGPLTYKSSGPYIASILGSAQSTQGSPELFISGPGTTPNSIAPSAASSSVVPSFAGSYAFALNTWYHIAIVRDSSAGIMSSYVNGTRVATKAVTGTYATTRPQIGAQSFSGWAGTFNGYFSDTRLTVGVARYSGASFAVPAAPVPAQ